MVDFAAVVLVLCQKDDHLLEAFVFLALEGIGKRKRSQNDLQQSPFQLILGNDENHHSFIGQQRGCFFHPGDQFVAGRLVVGWIQQDQIEFAGKLHVEERRVEFLG